jgi:sortase (surface protein transpeptidase)
LAAISAQYGSGSVIDEAKRDRRAWLIVLLISCSVMVVIAGCRLATAANSAGGEGSPSSPAKALLPTPYGQARQTSEWHTHPAVQGTPEQEPGLPRRLVIPRLGVKMPIAAVAVDADGAMALPPRPTQIGWYAYGPRPGASQGSAVLGGHVDSRQYGVGPLVALKRLRPGDDIVVVTDDGTERFRVRSVQLVSKQGLDLRQVFDRDGDRLLRIITCGGTFRRSQGGYQANVVVTALPR